jgi:hypothetical protein
MTIRHQIEMHGGAASKLTDSIFGSKLIPAKVSQGTLSSPESILLHLAPDIRKPTS